ncbi:Beta-galactosidase 3 [Camellia lanceoleosa]|uniref:Beta-galactosidase 3 n=1 Tax=Camellia lanceoleosa TaxID=1840588 RepID=A0ACC0HV20_9ERIC|nr:Beta-galactosidase 3 [Camellia lanceoleosa]
MCYHMNTWNNMKELHSSIKLCERALVSADPTVTLLGSYSQAHVFSSNILPDCKNVVFNTAKVGVQTSQMQMLPTNAELLSWETFSEDISSADEDSKITVVGLLEQLNVTRDTSDYLWYMTSVEISPSESFLYSGQHLTLIVQSAGDALHVFTDGQLPALFQIVRTATSGGMA